MYPFGMAGYFFSGGAARGASREVPPTARCSTPVAGRYGGPPTGHLSTPHVPTPHRSGPRSRGVGATGATGYAASMHRSRVYAVIIDAPRAEAAQATAFWSAALGVPAEPYAPEPHFTTLHEALPGLVTAVQAVDDAPRIHIDIETDDVEAETARLVGLGATQVRQWQECRVLRVPGGHLVCVLPVESAPGEFDARSRTWP